METAISETVSSGSSAMMSQQQREQQHIRPKKRVTVGGTKKFKTPPQQQQQQPPPAVSSTGSKVQKWVQQPSHQGKKVTITPSATSDACSTSASTTADSPVHQTPKSILKKSKYKLIAPDGTTSSIKEHEAATPAPSETCSIVNAQDQSSTTSTTAATVRPVQDLVIERKRRPRRKVTSSSGNLVQGNNNNIPTCQQNHTTVEGFTPTTHSCTDHNLLPKSIPSISKASVEKKESSSSSLTPRSMPEEMNGNVVTMVPENKSLDDDDDNNNQNNIIGHDDDNDNTDPLIFNSLADLMEAAGTLPQQDFNNTNTNTIPPRAVVEAQLDFTCMEPTAFETLQQEQVKEQYEIFLGTQNPFSSSATNTSASDANNNKEEDSETEEESSDEQDEDEEEDDLWGILGDRNEEPTVPLEPRAFTKLWNALSQWVTPEAVSFMEHLQARNVVADPALDNDNVAVYQSEWDGVVVDRSDIGASRCAGVMSLMRIHMKKCLVEELNESLESLRTAERRVADLLRCFNYSRPTPKMDSALAKALTCIFLDMVLVEGWSARRSNGDLVPACCQMLGMTYDEYHYLTRSAIVRFKVLPDQD